MSNVKAAYENIVDVSRIGQHGWVDFNEIIPGTNESLFTLAAKEELRPARLDPKRRLLLCIDVQNDFIDGGALGVPGAIGDVERITRFIHKNMNEISTIMCSMDTHSPFQIFHPAWWINKDGNHPDPYTIITRSDVENGLWSPLYYLTDSLTYLEKLEEIGKKQLCIWPYHCIVGTPGHGLENEFSKMVYYWSFAKKAMVQIVRKGQDPLSEIYGIIKPEYDKKNFINTPVLNAIEKYEEIYIVGEAASHCLLESLRQILEYFANRPEITRKITVLQDCTSPIGGYEQLVKDTFKEFKSKYGVKFVNSTEVDLCAA